MDIRSQRGGSKKLLLNIKKKINISLIIILKIEFDINRKKNLKMDEHSRLGIKINYRKRKIDDRSSLGKAVQYLEKARRNKMHNFHLADLYSLMQRLFIVGKYHKTIALLNKYKCWACEEGLPQGYSIHDCEEEFYISRMSF